MSALEECVWQMLASTNQIICRNDSSMTGTPDFVLNHGQIVIFVHGCFWHGHTCKRWKLDGVWKSRISANIKRDTEVREHYLKSNTYYVRIWECELTQDPRNVEQKVKSIITHL